MGHTKYKNMEMEVETDMGRETEVEMLVVIGSVVLIYFLVLIVFILIFFIQGSEEAEQRLLLPAPRLRPLGLLERGRF